MRWSACLLLAVAVAAGEADPWQGAASPHPSGGYEVRQGGTAVRVPTQEAALPDAPAALAELAPRIAGQPGWTLRHGLLAGWTLHTGERMLCAAGELRKGAAPPTADDEVVRGAVKAARDLAAATIDPALGAAAADGLRRQLARLDQVDNTVERRLVATAWSEGLIGGEARSALTRALEAAAALRLREVWSGDGVRLERLADAWGREVWLWRSPTRLAYAVPAMPRAHSTQTPLRLVVELPPDADPWRDVARARSASLRLGACTVARWDGQVVLADEPGWAMANAPIGGDDLPDWPTPVIALATPDGRLDSLLIGRQRIAAPADGGADSEAFLDRAATLRDPGELAAIGDFIFSYTYDSPDPAVPRLLGEAGRYADIHQTATATLATALAGRFRGDCDDLAEVYTTILARQGRLAHVMDFGNHAAAGFLERDGEDWAMHVLHSGPAMRWCADRPADAVLAAYTALANATSMPRSADGIGVLLRFAGESTRSPWRLSWRIFAEPVYAATMIAVQRDWHFRTYHHGIAAMQALLDAGDRDPANLTELSGLHRRMRDWDPALAWHRRLMALHDGGTQHERIAEITLLTSAGRHAEAARAALAAAEHRLPALQERDQQAAVILAADLAQRVVEPEGRRALTGRWIAPWVEEHETEVRTWIDNRFSAGTWAADPMARAWRAGAALVAEQRLARWRADGRRAASADWRWLDWWYGRVCALPGGGQVNPLWLVSGAGFWLQERLGQAGVDRLVAAARPPAARNDAVLRFDGFTATPRIASWLRVSVPWWEERIASAARLPVGAARETAVRAALAGLDEALAALPTLDLAEAGSEGIAIRSRLIAALAIDDAGLLESTLNALAARRDRELDEAAAGILGGWGGGLPPERFAAVLARWHTVAGVPAFALEVAWSALHAERWEAARIAARDAAARTPGDSAVAAEAAHIVERTAGR